MAENDAELDYAYIAQNALRGVVRDVLSITEALGTPPGDHHFYIEFLTGAPGVDISSRLKGQYPERMTIVLQHQFEDLIVGDSHFEVTLYFGGVPDRLVIPYDAVAQFADPSVNFALQFPTDQIEIPTDTSETSDADDTPATTAKVEALKPRPAPETDNEDDDPEPSPPSGGSADVVSLDRFRKK